MYPAGGYPGLYFPTFSGLTAGASQVFYGVDGEFIFPQARTGPTIVWEYEDGEMGAIASAPDTGPPPTTITLTDGLLAHCLLSDPVSVGGGSLQLNLTAMQGEASITSPVGVGGAFLQIEATTIPLSVIFGTPFNTWTISQFLPFQVLIELVTPTLSRNLAVTPLQAQVDSFSEGSQLMQRLIPEPLTFEVAIGQDFVWVINSSSFGHLRVLAYPMAGTRFFLDPGQPMVGLRTADGNVYPKKTVE